MASAPFIDIASVFVSAVSLALCLFVLCVYWLYPGTRLHPNKILIHHAFGDAILSLCFILSRSKLISGNNGCKSPLGVLVSFLCQYALLSAELSFFFLAFDGLLTVRRPFTDMSKRYTYYGVSIQVTSILSSCILIAVKKYGRHLTRLCWVESSRVRFNITSWGFYYVWIAVIYIASIAILIMMANCLSKIPIYQEDLLKERAALLEKMMLYVFAYMIYGTCVAITYGLNEIINPDFATYTYSFVTSYCLELLFYIILTSRGVVTSYMFLYNVKHIWKPKGSLKEELAGGLKRGLHFTRDITWYMEAQPLLNNVIRKQILAIFSRGVVTSIDKSILKDNNMKLFGCEGMYNDVLEKPEYYDEKQVIPIDSTLEDSKDEVIQFVEYSPIVFSYIRYLDHIPNVDYQNDLSDLSECSCSEGASGALFVNSKSKRFIVKFVGHSEFDVLHKLLHDLTYYLTESQMNHLPAEGEMDNALSTECGQYEDDMRETEGEINSSYPTNVFPIPATEGEEDEIGEIALNENDPDLSAPSQAMDAHDLFVSMQDDHGAVPMNMMRSQSSQHVNPSVGYNANLRNSCSSETATLLNPPKSLSARDEPLPNPFSNRAGPIPQLLHCGMARSAMSILHTRHTSLASAENSDASNNLESLRKKSSYQGSDASSRDEVVVPIDLNQSFTESPYPHSTASQATEGVNDLIQHAILPEAHSPRSEVSYQQRQLNGSSSSLLQNGQNIIMYDNVNINSFLNRYYGMYSITLFGQTLYFVVMENILPPIYLKEVYDLKGSCVDRVPKEKHRGQLVTCRHCSKSYVYGVETECISSNSLHDPMITKKDNNLRGDIVVDQLMNQRISNQLREDAGFLRRHGLMDYSLLLGIANVQIKLGDEARFITSNMSEITQIPFSTRVVEGPGLFYIGIIDYLQEYTLKKKLERFWKVFIRRQDKDGISDTPPQKYFDRFIEHVVGKLFVEYSDAVYNNEWETNDFDPSMDLLPAEDGSDAKPLSTDHSRPNTIRESVSKRSMNPNPSIRVMNNSSHHLRGEKSSSSRSSERFRLASSSALQKAQTTEVTHSYGSISQRPYTSETNLAGTENRMSITGLGTELVMHSSSSTSALSPYRNSGTPYGDSARELNKLNLPTYLEGQRGSNLLGSLNTLNEGTEPGDGNETQIV